MGRAGVRSNEFVVGKGYGVMWLDFQLGRGSDG